MTPEQADKAFDLASKVETTAVVGFHDSNGDHEATVGVDGEFWRVVTVRAPSFGLPPDAALELARAIIRAAHRCQREERIRNQARDILQQKGA